MSDSRPVTKGDHVYLVDGSGYIFRAYHALPPLTRKSDGLPVGAVSGFCNMLHKLLDDMRDGAERNGNGQSEIPAPTHLAVIFDPKGGSFRNEIFDAYKANRDAPPEDLVPQFSIIRDAVRAFNVPAVEIPGYEADDLIATYARLTVERGADVTIISSDKDLMQLVGPNVRMFDSMKNRVINSEEVFEKFGVSPDKVIDVQSLAGDSTDNIPGVPGIGVKTAALLINEYGDLDTLLERAEEIKQNKRRENLIEFAEQARISRELVTLKQDVEVETSVDDFLIKPANATDLIGFLKSMEFSTLTRRVAAELSVDENSIAVSEEHAAEEKLEAKPLASEATGEPGAVPLGLDVPINVSSYDRVTTHEDLDRWIAAAYAKGSFSVDTETTGLDSMEAELVGISMAIEPGKACYIPFLHGKAQHAGALDLGDAEAPEQLDRTEALSSLKSLFEDSSVLKIGQNLKYDIVVLRRYGVTLTPIDDTMLLSYALDAGLHGHGMDELSQLYLNHKPIPFKEIAGSGKKALTFDQIPLDKATEYAAEDADVTLRLHGYLKPRLVADRMTTVYETLERPLVHVLCAMESQGTRVDRQILSRLSGDFAQRMAALEEEIHELAGEKFNIGSPKQLGEILFDKMSLPGAKKTKTGAYQTGAEILDDLAAQGHDLPARVLDWRQLSKLRSTYTEALQEFINPETGRVHTSYSMAGTSTGRLASNDPNLQNIPVRTEDGRKIRTAFVPEPGNKLISADYSQIELRLLAHIADIDALKQAFADGLDIHAMTASQMFDTPIEGMDPSVRRRAKAINFGIIYGISAFGLARQLGIPQGEASDYIKHYFERFPGIRAYMEDTKEFCRQNGYVETIFGRRIHLPGINQKNGAMRAFTERAAINAPIQGSAADVIRRAMIKMPEALKDAGLKDTRMLLQVHDELIFELPEKDVDKTIATVSATMEAACSPALELSVPLTVDARAGDSWNEAH